MVRARQRARRRCHARAAGQPDQGLRYRELPSDVEGLRLVLASVLGDRYQVRVANAGSAAPRAFKVQRVIDSK